MANEWIRLLGGVKTYVDNLVTILTTVGSEPAVGAVDTIENSNKLIYDELAAYGKLITFKIPTEYHTAYEYQRFENTESGTSGGMTVFYQYPFRYPFNYNGGLGVIFKANTAYPNTLKHWLYDYLTNTSVPISISMEPTYIEYTDRLIIYGYGLDSKTGEPIYMKSEYDSSFVETKRELSPMNYGFSANTTNNPDGVDIVIAGKLIFTNNVGYKNLQKIDSGWFCGVKEKAIFLDDDYLPTRQIQFNDPRLLGYTPSPTSQWINTAWQSNYMIPDIYYLDDIYLIYYDGRIERYKI